MAFALPRLSWILTITVSAVNMFGNVLRSIGITTKTFDLSMVSTEYYCYSILNGCLVVLVVTQFNCVKMHEHSTPDPKSWIPWIFSSAMREDYVSRRN